MRTQRPPARVARRIVRRTAAAACGLTFAAATAHAQAGTAPRAAGPYERARSLVESGRGAAGRLLTDSLVGLSAPGSPARAEALWWRAALAADAGGAERDLRRLIGEVPASPRAGTATVRLAQLALVRDRPEEAAALLDPIVRGPARGAPVDFARPQAAYWLARARLEQRDAAGTCAALDSAAASGAAALDPGFAGQLAALRRRVPACVDVPATVAVAAAPRSAAFTASPSAPPFTSPAPPPTAQPSVQPFVQPPAVPRSTVPRSVTPSPPAVQPPAPQPPVVIPPGPVPGPPAESSRGPTPAPRPTPTPPAPTPPAPTPTAPPRAAPAPVPAPPPAVAPAPAAPAFAVQVAAYDTRGGAEALAARLRAGGLDARAEGQGAAGDAAPFRIKIGRYPTRAAAAAALRELRTRGLTGFVTDAGRAAGGTP